MRTTIKQQQSLTQAFIDHGHAQELAVISDILDEVSHVLDRVLTDIARGRRTDRGREGMTAEQVLRVFVIKQMHGFSYEQLTFELAANSCYRTFCRFGDFDKTPKCSTLKKNLKMLSPETTEFINLAVLAVRERVQSRRRAEGASRLHQCRNGHPRACGFDVVMERGSRADSAHEADAGRTWRLVQQSQSTITDGNPADSKLATGMIERHVETYGRAPRQAAFDGGFASKDNVASIKNLGVEDVAFSKRCGIEITDMVKSSWVYRRLRDFRAGVEGVISFFKRCFGGSRCNWRGLRSFKTYVWGSIVSCNLLVLARHRLATA